MRGLSFKLAEFECIHISTCTSRHLALKRILNHMNSFILKFLDKCKGFIHQNKNKLSLNRDVFNYV